MSETGLVKTDTRSKHLPKNLREPAIAYSRLDNPDQPPSLWSPVHGGAPQRTGNAAHRRNLSKGGVFLSNAILESGLLVYAKVVIALLCREVRPVPPEGFSLPPQAAANRDLISGYVTITRDEIARRLNISVITVYHSLLLARNAGVLDWDSGIRQGQPNVPNTYWVLDQECWSRSLNNPGIWAKYGIGQLTAAKHEEIRQAALAYDERLDDLANEEDQPVGASSLLPADSVIFSISAVSETHHEEHEPHREGNVANDASVISAVNDSGCRELVPVAPALPFECEMPQVRALREWAAAAHVNLDVTVPPPPGNSLFGGWDSLVCFMKVFSRTGVPIVLLYVLARAIEEHYRHIKRVIRNPWGVLHSAAYHPERWLERLPSPAAANWGAPPTADPFGTMVAPEKQRNQACSPSDPIRTQKTNLLEKISDPPKPSPLPSPSPRSPQAGATLPGKNTSPGRVISFAYASVEQQLRGWWDALYTAGLTVAVQILRPAPEPGADRPGIPRIVSASKLLDPDFLAYLKFENCQGADVYVTPNALNPGATSRTVSNIAPPRALYLDLDQGLRKLYHATRLIGPPTVLLRSSLGHYQAVWRLTRPVAPEIAKAWMSILVGMTNADPACIDVARVLRMPGFANHKYPDQPLKERWVTLISAGPAIDLPPLPHAAGRLLPAAVLESSPSAVPSRTILSPSDQIAVDNPVGWLQAKLELLRPSPRMRADIETLFANRDLPCWGKPATPSQRDYGLARRLHIAGADRETIAQALRAAATRRNCRPKSDLERYIRLTIDKATARS